MSTVYIPQEVFYKNERGELVQKYATHLAERYGDIRVLLPWGKIALAPQPMIGRLRTILKNFDDEDYILPMGDPAAIGATIAIAASFNGGKVKLLRWDRTACQYRVTPMNLHGGKVDD